MNWTGDEQLERLISELEQLATAFEKWTKPAADLAADASQFRVCFRLDPPL